jgi:glucan phosphoethanolaminetransferase (alkaline phosphatase superfamily)
MTVEKKLLIKSMGFSFIITLLLIVIAYVQVWEIMNEKEREIFPLYAVISSLIIFFILTVVFYFDIRNILERKSL